MKTFIADIIPKIQRFSQQLEDLTKLTNQHWISLGEINQTKKVFIFRSNNQLIISENGIVEKGSWEYLGNQSLLIETKQESYLLKHGFFDENVIALKLDSTDSYAFFVNENKYHTELNNIQDIINFLTKKYLSKTVNENDVSFENQKEYIKIPEYKIIDITEKPSLFKGITKIYKIHFFDGIEGEVFLKVNDNKIYYKEKLPNLWYTEMHYYQNLELCIKAVYYFLTTGLKQNEGYIKTEYYP